MKPTKRILIFLIFMLFLMANLGVVSANTVMDQPPPINGDKVVVGQIFTLKEDQTLNGDLAVIGGTVNLETGSRVVGDVVIIGSTLEMDGTVTGNIMALGGSVSLGSNSVIEGSFNNYGSKLNQENGARIEGSQISNVPFEFNFDKFNSPEIPDTPVKAARQTAGFMAKMLWAVLQILAMGGLAMLILLIAPKPTERIANSIRKQPFTHWGVGLLTAFAFPAIIVVCFITIIFIPLGLIGIMAMVLAVFYAWIAMGYEVGRRLFNNQANLSQPVVAGLGTVIISVVGRILGAIPCIGWLLVSALSFFGLGALILTRVGSKDYPDIIPHQPMKDQIFIPSNSDIIPSDEQNEEQSQEPDKN